MHTPCDECITFVCIGSNKHFHYLVMFVVHTVSVAISQGKLLNSLCKFAIMMTCSGNS